MEELRAVLSNEDEPKPMSPRIRELIRRLVAILIIVLGMAVIIWDANK